MSLKFVYPLSISKVHYNLLNVPRAPNHNTKLIWESQCEEYDHKSQWYSNSIFPRYPENIPDILDPPPSSIDTDSQTTTAV